MTKILLVDDHPAICFALRVLLEKNPDFTVTTSSGENLLALLHREQPSLLILDLELKNADGLDLLPRIKHHFPALRVLVYTNQPAGVYALRTLRAGASGFINKSLALERVEPACQLLLDGYHCFPEETFAKAAEATEVKPDARALLSRFSDREIAVLNYLKQGSSNKEIADRLALSNKTISTYKARMMKKSGVAHFEQLFDLLDTPGSES
ncbi:response regulator transcription factor [Enterobacter cloacae complex sp. 2022EL-00788]|uniref:response regulator transcription factor n=1 Tax=Enterobacter cloacae complex sp. 2022EL-00788 TaxID=2996512 RepID=UPI0022711476|nr:response regulator transcription factor [Enterobacter cloacae complex sp. 2022EL-00788]MCY0772582.1 response regulator transcription factor [Enterobacter cloacae complex sp. 2022EL-00788]